MAACAFSTAACACSTNGGLRLLRLLNDSRCSPQATEGGMVDATGTHAKHKHEATEAGVLVGAAAAYAMVTGNE